MRLLQKSTVSHSCLQDCPDFAERMKRKALRVKSEGSTPPYVTKAESREQQSDSPLCNSLEIGLSRCCPDLSILGTFVVTAEASKKQVRASVGKIVILTSFIYLIDYVTESTRRVVPLFGTLLWRAGARHALLPRCLTH